MLQSPPKTGTNPTPAPNNSNILPKSHPVLFPTPAHHAILRIPPPDRMLRDLGSRSGGGRQIRPGGPETARTEGIGIDIPGATLSSGETPRRGQCGLTRRMAGRSNPAGGEENRTGAGTPLTRVSAGRPAGAMATTASSAGGKDGFGGAGRANETNRPPRMIATIPGTTRRPEGIGSDTGGARAGGPKATTLVSHPGSPGRVPRIPALAGDTERQRAVGDTSHARGLGVPKVKTRSRKTKASRPIHPHLRHPRPPSLGSIP